MKAVKTWQSTVSCMTQICVAVMLVCLVPMAHAWAESSFSRAQVEKHLRTMFLNIAPSPAELAALPPGQRAMTSGLQSFYAHAGMKVIRYGVMEVKPGEVDTVLEMIREIEDLTGVKFQGVKPRPWNFDLLIILFNDLATQALTPGARRYLQFQETDEEYEEMIRALVESAQGAAPVSGDFRLRPKGPPIAIMAMQRYVPKDNEIFPVSLQVRHVLLNALTRAQQSDVIQPSVTNTLPIVEADHFFPIDRAVLRAIFGHHDWAAMDYETRIQRLTDRVMAQLAANP